MNKELEGWSKRFDENFEQVEYGRIIDLTPIRNRYDEIIQEHSGVVEIEKIKSFLASELKLQKAEILSKPEQDWREKLQEFAIINEMYIRGFPMGKLESFITSLLKAQKAEILEKVNEVKKRFRCAACEGSKCQHTLGCQALEDIKKVIGDKIVWE